VATSHFLMRAKWAMLRRAIAWAENLTLVKLAQRVVDAFHSPDPAPVSLVDHGDS
jgi:hypothetical protein